MNIKPVRPKDQVCFHCRRCGNCCQDLEEKLMLEPLDAYRLARYLRGEASSIDDIYANYLHTDILEGCLPIYLMNTTGPDHTCVFLKDGRCSVYDGRPRACRMYPFTVFPGERGRAFAYYQCIDGHSDHYSDGRVLMKNWIFQNFTRDDREFLAAEGKALPKLGSLLRQLGAEQLKGSLLQILHYRYYNYDLDKPFLPQYMSNMTALEQVLLERLEEAR